MKGFRQFILRGNVVDLAVGVVMGAAFGTVVSALVKDFLTPLIAAIAGKPDFSALGFEYQRDQIPDRRFHQRRGFFSAHRRRNLFLRRLAGKHADSACEARRSTARPDLEEMPRMPERYTNRRA